MTFATRKQLQQVTTSFEQLNKYLTHFQQLSKIVINLQVKILHHN